MPTCLYADGCYVDGEGSHRCECGRPRSSDGSDGGPCHCGPA